MSKCTSCVHKVDIPGNYHIGCANKDARPSIKGWPGCGFWPLTFDPAIVVDCNGFSDNPEDKHEAKDDPLTAIARILGGI